MLLRSVVVWTLVAPLSEAQVSRGPFGFLNLFYPGNCQLRMRAPCEEFGSIDLDLAAVILARLLCLLAKTR